MGASPAIRAAEPLLDVRGLTKRFGRHVVLTDVDLSVARRRARRAGGRERRREDEPRPVRGRHADPRCRTGAPRLAAGPTSAWCGRTSRCATTSMPPPTSSSGASCTAARGSRTPTCTSPPRRSSTSSASQIDDLRRPASQLSGGQRQALAIARALLGRPRLLVLDEPTAALGVAETHMVERHRPRAAGSRAAAILLISHRIEQVFRLADRVVVLRHGRVVANRATVELHPDDVIALMAGVEADTSARGQIQRLHSLVDQLAEEEPSASIPLIVSALSAALGADQVCVHLLDDHPGSEEPPVLRCRAAVGVREPLLARSQVLPLGTEGGLVGLAAANRSVVVTEHVHDHPAWAELRDAGHRGRRALGVGDADPGRGRRARRDLGLRRRGRDAAARGPRAGVAVHEPGRRRDRPGAPARARSPGATTSSSRCAACSRRSTGPLAAQAGMTPALEVLCEGLAADAVALLEGSGDGAAPAVRVATGSADGQPVPQATEDLVAAAATVLDGPAGIDRARLIGAPTSWPHRSRHRRAGSCWRRGGTRPRAIGNDTFDLLEDAARSLSLAVEREEVELAQAESATLRRSQLLQREFLSHLSHELRTPLTAIHGYASTLRQTDVTWDEVSEHRFLGPDRGRVGPDGPAGRRPARLVDDGGGRAAARPALVRPRAGRRCRGGLRRRRRGRRGGRRRPRGAGGVGRPRPPRAGPREPDRERDAPRRGGGPRPGQATRRRSTARSTIRVHDDGPGLPARARRRGLPAVRARRHRRARAPASA